MSNDQAAANHTKKVFVVRVAYPDGENEIRTRVLYGPHEPVVSVLTYPTRDEADSMASILKDSYPDHSFAVEEYGG